jgi:hypothetical protein
MIVSIRVRTDKRGRRIAHYWGRLAGRWLPMPLKEAELALATGTWRGKQVSYG